MVVIQTRRSHREKKPKIDADYVYEAVSQTNSPTDNEHITINSVTLDETSSQQIPVSPPPLSWINTVSSFVSTPVKKLSETVLGSPITSEVNDRVNILLENTDSLYDSVSSNIVSVIIHPPTDPSTTPVKKLSETILGSPITNEENNSVSDDIKSQVDIKSHRKLSQAPKKREKKRKCKG